MSSPKKASPKRASPKRSSPYGKSKVDGGKRHRREFKDEIAGITKGALRRLARRGGVKRISSGIYEEARVYLRAWLERVVSHACYYMQHCRRNTVRVQDVVMALKKNGRTLYGF